MMDEKFIKKDWNLNKCSSKVYEGLIFINLSENPDDFNKIHKSGKRLYRITWFK